MGLVSACVTLVIFIQQCRCLKLAPDLRVAEDPQPKTLGINSLRNLNLQPPSPDNHVSTCDWNTRLTQFLLDENKDRLELKFKLETKITELYEQIQQMKSIIVQQEEASLARPPNKGVGFTAEVESHLTGLTRDQTIVFASMRTNVGSAYNPETGVFTCPTPGLYLFSATILSNLGDRIETEMILKKKEGDQSSVGKLYSGADSTDRYGSGSKTVILQLSAGDRVWVRVYNGLGSFIFKLWSSFTGTLIQPN